MADNAVSSPQDTPENISRREFLTKGGILLAAATLSSTTLAADGIKDGTRKRVAELQASDPKFKLSTDAQNCLSGIEKDPECDQFVNDETSEYISSKRINAREQQVNAREQQVNAREQQVNAREQQVAIAREAIENIHISRAMTQLVLYVLLEQIPPKDDDYMDKILSYSSTPTDIRDIMKETLQRKKSGKSFTKTEGNKLLDLAQRHLNKAVSLGSQLNEPTLKKNITGMNTSFKEYLLVVKHKITSV